MARKKTQPQPLSPGAQRVKERLEKFSRIKGIPLATYNPALNVRFEQLAENGGRCPCHHDRLHCPCQQLFEEFRTKGECGCRLFGDYEKYKQAQNSGQPTLR